MYRMIIDVEMCDADEVIGAKDVIAATLEQIKDVKLVRVDEVVQIDEAEQTKL